jgi:hypothetical protein
VNPIISEFAKKVKTSLGGKILRVGVRKEESSVEIFLVVKNKDCLLREKIYDILYEIDPLDELGASIKIFSEFEYLKKQG